MEYMHVVDSRNMVEAWRCLQCSSCMGI